MVCGDTVLTQLSDLTATKLTCINSRNTHKLRILLGIYFPPKLSLLSGCKETGHPCSEYRVKRKSAYKSFEVPLTNWSAAFYTQSIYLLKQPANDQLHTHNQQVVAGEKEFISGK